MRSQRTRPNKPCRYILKCGDDEVGSIDFDDFENWHCYGKLLPGASYSMYRERLEMLASAILREDEVLDTASDAEVDKLAEARTMAQDSIDALGFYLQDELTGSTHKIHDFKLVDHGGRVYWRFDT